MSLHGKPPVLSHSRDEAFLCWVCSLPPQPISNGLAKANRRPTTYPNHRESVVAVKRLTYVVSGSPNISERTECKKFSSFVAFEQLSPT